MEPRFGHDFGRVRVHTDARAAKSAREENALAYTVGTNVVFGEGQFASATSEGRRLLAHELTHVLQQEDKALTPSPDLAMSPADSPLEREAQRLADVVGHESQPPAGPLPGPTIARCNTPVVQRAVRFQPNRQLAIGHWTAGATTIGPDTVDIAHGDFEASAEIHAEADAAGEFADWEVGFLQNDRITWSRSYWTRENADGRGRLLESKLRVPNTPLRDHANDAIVWAAPGEFRDVAAAAGGALSVDIPLSSSDAPSTPVGIDGSSVTGADASDGTDNLFQFRQGDNFISFVSAHNTATGEWRHLELIYWSVQDSVDFASNAAGAVTTTRDDRNLGQSRRFRWTPTADQPAIGATLANTYVNEPANTTVSRVNGWT